MRLYHSTRIFQMSALSIVYRFQLYWCFICADQECLENRIIKHLLNCHCCFTSKEKKDRKENKSANFLKGERRGCMFGVARCKSPTLYSISLQIEVSEQTLKELTDVRFSRTPSLSQPDRNKRDSDRLPAPGSRQKSAYCTFSGHLTQNKQNKETIQG